MILTYKYRLYQSKRDRHLNSFALMKHLTKLKKRSKYVWLKLIPSQALQDIVQRIEKGYQLFFKSGRGENGIKVRPPPTFKKSRTYKSFTLKQAGYKFLPDRKPGTSSSKSGS